MELRVALVVFCGLLDFSQSLLQPLAKPACLLTGLECTRNTSETFFRFYRNLTDYTDLYKNNCSVLTSAPGFDLNKNTTFYFHGWSEHLKKRSVLTIVSAYTAVKEENIVVFDWSTYSISNYPGAASKVSVAANESLNLMDCFIAAGLRADSIKLLGMSLGGQMVGAIGNSYKARHNRTIRHITGLDPAMPLFYPLNNNLKEDSGDFVSVIHTTSGFAGYPPPMGQVDFLPNFGTVPQMPCPLKAPGAVFEAVGTTWDTAKSAEDLAILCDHHCAWRYYAVSVMRKDAYQTNCIGVCNSNTTTMGYATPVGTRGFYYIDTICPDTTYIYDPAAN